MVRAGAVWGWRQVRILVVGTLLFALALLGLGGCASSSGTAATVLGVEIAEQDVTDYIDKFRSTMGYESDESWSDYLEEQGVTPEQFRVNTVYELAADAVIEHYAQEEGLVVDEDVVQARIDALRTTLLAEDDETWQETLELYQLDEDALRETYGNENLQAQVYQALVDPVEPTDEQVIAYIEENLTGLTTRRVQRIRGVDYVQMQALMEEVRAAANASKGFALAKEQADGESIIAEELGWDVNGTLDDTLASAVDDLSKGEVATTLVSTTEGYQIVYCQDLYSFPDEVDLTELPEGLKDDVTSLASYGLWNTACSNWLRQQIEDTLVVNDMPAGLPYDVEVELSTAGDDNSSDAEAE